MSANKMFKIARTLILVATFLSVFNLSYGQNASVTINPWSKTDTTGNDAKFNRLIQRANGLAQIKLETALLVLDSALAIIKVGSDLRKYTVYLGNRGLILLNNGRNKEAGCWLHLSASLAKKYGWRELERALINVLACNYLYLARYDSALHFQLQFLNQAASVNDSDHLFIGYLNLGMLYYKLHDPRNALRFYSRAEAVRKDQKIDRLYLNIGLCYNYLEKYDSALMYYKLAHETIPPHSNEHMINYHYGIGLAISNLKKYDSASYHLHEANRIAAIKDDKRFIAETGSILGEVAMAKRDFSAARYQLKRAELLTEKHSLNALAQENYLRLASLYKANGDLKNQTLYQARYIKYSRVVYDEELMSKIALMEVENNEAANFKKIEGQKSLLSLQRSLTESRGKVLILAGIAGGLLLIVFVFLIIANNRNARMNAMLEYIVVEQTIDLEESYKDAINAKENVDQRIKVWTGNLKSHFATIKGFCFVGISELNSSEKEVLSHVFSRVSEIENSGIKVSD
jgi:tetratricopeptide (TPR) repeat protein